MKEQIQEILQQIEKINATNSEELEAIRLKYLSKKGVISDLFSRFREVAPDQKKEIGEQLNKLKNTASERFNELQNKLNALKIDYNKADLTRTPDPIKL